MTRVRVESFTMSLDGYGAGPDQSVNDPVGVGAEALHDWVVSTRTWRQLHGKEGGEGGVDDGMDVIIGGGANTIQQYLRSGLIDELHVAIAPILLGGGERLFAGVDLPALGCECLQFVGSEKATHVVLGRQAQ